MDRYTTKYIRILSLFGMLLAGVLGIASVAAALEVGDQAPDFTLPSTTGEKIRLSQFQGKKHVLIQFYHIDFGPRCTANLSTRKDDFSKFENLNVQLLGISASNPFSQKTFADSLKLPFPLLSDFPDLKVIRKYGELKHVGEAKRPMAKGTFFLIDKQGIIRGKWMRMNPPLQIFSSDPFLELAQQLEKKL